MLSLRLWGPLAVIIAAFVTGAPALAQGVGDFYRNRQLQIVVGYGPGGTRLGYGGGFYDRTLAALQPAPYTVGVGYGHGFVPWLAAEPHDVPLDAILTEDGVHWQRKP